MKLRSITIKLLPLIIISFVLIIVGVLFISKMQLTKIIDKSQHEIFAEKVDVIWGTLNRNNLRLQKTGLVEAYEDDIKSSTIDNLKNTYYRQEKILLKPIIIDKKSTVILHPTYPAGHILLAGDNKLFSNQTVQEGEFYAATDGRKAWYVYRVFEPWKWIIVYAVPLDEKYEDVRKFSSLLLFTMLTITLLVAIFLSLAIARLMRPIGALTAKVLEISKGNLSDPIDIHSSDEIGLLAENFDNMRKAIQSQFTELNTEVAERKKIEIELRDLEGYLSDIIDSMPSVIIGIDAQLNVTQWNSNAEKITGIPAAQANNSPLAEIYPELKEIYPVISESLAQCEIKKLTKRERKGDSGSIYEDITIYPLSSRSVHAAGAVIRIDNVTKEYELEAQIQHSRRMDAIGQLAGGVAHDFNNMLSGISGASELLEITLVGKEKELKFISMIKNATERAAGLTEKLLAYSRKGKLLSTAVDLHVIIKDAIAILERSIDKRINIQTDLKAKQYMVIGDPSQLQSGILNICVNARDAMPDGGDIHISTVDIEFNEDDCRMDPKFTPGKYIKVSIEDSGTGIPAELQSKIFEPFFTTKEIGKGTGLGLAAVYGMVKEHHGNIQLYSEPGKGTVFHVFFPTSEAAVPRATQQNERVVRGTGTILVVDDEDIIRATALLLLENLGYIVLLAQNGKEAVDIYRSKVDEIDLVILDIVMPVMDGREAFEKIIGINPQAKVIMSSGYAKNVNMASMVDKGLAGFVAKPFNQLELSKLIADVLQH
ncbi:MAG: ATP-binding protein [Desulforhopalus sp.]